MTEQEYALLQKKAEEEDITIAAYVRLLISGQTKAYHADLDRLIYEINKIGTNINQIAWRLNGTGYYDKEQFDTCKKNLQDILAEVENGNFKIIECEGNKTGEK